MISNRIHTITSHVTRWKTIPPTTANRKKHLNSVQNVATKDTYGKIARRGPKDALTAMVNTGHSR